MPASLAASMKASRQAVQVTFSSRASKQVCRATVNLSPVSTGQCATSHSAAWTTDLMFFVSPKAVVMVTLGNESSRMPINAQPSSGFLCYSGGDWNFTMARSFGYAGPTFPPFADQASRALRESELESMDGWSIHDGGNPNSSHRRSSPVQRGR